jgi:hypothetical protein
MSRWFRRGGWLWKDRHWIICLVLVLDLLLMGCLWYVRLAVDHEKLQTVQLAVGSENLAFFRDPDVQAEFKKHNLTVQATGFGSYQLATTVPKDSYDAFLPSSQVFAKLVERRFKGTFPTYTPFETPLAVFTWQPLLHMLETDGIVNRNGQFDVAAYIRDAGQGLRWNGLQGVYSQLNRTRILLRMSDPTQSDSGAMFVAAASYVLNSGTVVTEHRQITPLARKIGSALALNGQMDPTTDLVYRAFLRGETPLALGYQSEELGKPAPSEGPFPGGAAGLPLTTSVSCEHVLVAFSANGQTVGGLLQDDPVLQGLEQKYGFISDRGRLLPSIPVPAADILKDLVNGTGLP